MNNILIYCACTEQLVCFVYHLILNYRKTVWSIKACLCWDGLKRQKSCFVKNLSPESVQRFSESRSKERKNFYEEQWYFVITQCLTTVLYHIKAQILTGVFIGMWIHYSFKIRNQGLPGVAVWHFWSLEFFISQTNPYSQTKHYTISIVCCSLYTLSV